MKASVSEPKSFQRVLSIEVPEEDLKTRISEKEKKYRRDFRMPGFRKGKVPSQLFKARAGSAVRAEALEEIISSSYQEACKQHSVVPVSEAKLTDMKADEGKPISFVIETEVDPKIEIKNYQKLKVKVSVKKIKNGDIDEALENLRDRLAEVRDASRSAKNGDLLTIEYRNVVIDGEPRNDFKNPEHPIELGTGKLKDFDKGFVGHAAGEEIDIDVKFPKDYAEETVAGKKGEFKIFIKKVQEKVLPEINEEFLKKIGDFKDEDALREHVRKDLEAREKERAKNEAYNEAIEKLIKNNPFDVPPSRVERYIDSVLEDMAKYQGNGKAPAREEIAEKYREMGEKLIKRYRIIDFIATAENIQATQEEVDEQIKRMADAYNQPFDQIKEALRKNGTTNRIRSDIREQKTLDFLVGGLDEAQE